MQIQVSLDGSNVEFITPTKAKQLSDVIVGHFLLALLGVEESGDNHERVLLAASFRASLDSSTRDVAVLSRSPDGQAIQDLTQQ